MKGGRAPPHAPPPPPWIRACQAKGWNKILGMGNWGGGRPIKEWFM